MNAIFVWIEPDRAQLYKALGVTATLEQTLAPQCWRSLYRVAQESVYWGTARPLVDLRVTSDVYGPLLPTVDEGVTTALEQRLAPFSRTHRGLEPGAGPGPELS